MISSAKLAFSFLTRFPVPGGEEYSEEDFQKSFLLFPVVGLAIGALLAITAMLLIWLGTHEAVTAFVLLAMLTAITGGLHLDGLADTADGFFGGKDKNAALLIMKDPRAGPFGTAAVTLTLIGKFTAIWAIVHSGLFLSLVAPFVLSRWAMAVVAYKSAYPRETGTAKFFVGGLTPQRFLYCSATTLALCLLLSGWKSVIIVPVAVLVACYIRFVSNRKIGGVTGDVLGATDELVELSVLMFV